MVQILPSHITVSVIIPAYNEAANIKAAVLEVLNDLPPLVSGYEIIIVDDGSSDRTADIVEEIIQVHPSIQLIRHDLNRGKGAALMTGFKNSRMDWILMLDADRQISLEAIPSLLGAATDYDMVIGYRLHYGASPLRRFSSKVFGLLIALLLGIRVKDVNCPFKLFKAELVTGIRMLSCGFLIDAELLAKANVAGYRLKEIGVEANTRTGGCSSVTPRHILETVTELRALKKQLTALKN